MIVNNADVFLTNYVELKKDFKVRKSNNYVEIVTSSGQRIFYNKTEKFKGGLYLFGMVKRDVLKYIAENGEVEPYDELPVNHSNQDYDYENETIGIDINNAYWSVAYLKGYISKSTYKKGIAKDNLKTIRLSSLSSLGKKRIYNVYKEGIHMHDEEHKGDMTLQKVYLDIRYSTYGVMLEIAKELGEDFCCWRTDCIFFHDTEQNQQLVRDIIEGYGLECKIELKSLNKLKPKANEV